MKSEKFKLNSASVTFKQEGNNLTVIIVANGKSEKHILPMPTKEPEDQYVAHDITEGFLAKFLINDKFEPFMGRLFPVNKLDKYLSKQYKIWSVCMTDKDPYAIEGRTFKDVIGYLVEAQ